MRGPSLTAQGVIGAVCVTLGGFLTNDLPPSPLRDAVAPLHWAYSTSTGRAVGWLLTFVGLSLLAAAWLGLVAQCRRASGESDQARAAALVRRLLVRWSIPLLVAPPLFSHDGWSYLAQGALTQSGRDPYHYTPGDMPELLTSMVDPIWRYTPTPYGPLPLTWGALCTEVTKDPIVLVWLQRVPVIIGLVLTAWAVPRLATRLGVNPALASALTLASPLMLAHGIGGMHNDALVMGLLACALVVTARGQWVWGATIIGIAAGVKFTAVVGVVPIVLLSLPAGVAWTKRLARLALGGIVAGIVTLVCGVPYGLGVGWVKALSVPGVVITPASIPTAIGVIVESVVGVFSESAAEPVMPVIRAVGMALAVALVVYLALTRPTGNLPSAMVTAAAVFAAVVLLAPVVHSWYALTVLPIGVFVALRSRRLGLVLALGLASVIGVMWDTRLAGASLLVAAVIVAAHLVVSRRPDRVPASLRAWLV